MASYNFSTRFNFWTKERIGWGRRSARSFSQATLLIILLLIIGRVECIWSSFTICAFVFMRLYLCICVIDYSPLIIGRIECISYSFSVYQGSLGWHFRSFCATRSQREAAIKYSGLVPHRALFRFLSLPEKEKSQHISTGTAVALIWGIFCKIPQFKVFAGSKLLVFGKKKKNILWLQFILRLKGKDSPEIFTQDLEGMHRVAS